MRLQGPIRAALRLVRGRVAPLAVLLLGAMLLLSPRGASAQDVRNFTFQNSSGLTVVQLFASPTTSQDWGSNALSNPVPPGQSRQISFPNRSASGFVPCQYDLRVVSQDGQAGETTVDLCSASVVAFPTGFTQVANVAPVAPSQGFAPVAPVQNQAMTEWFVLRNTSPVAIVELYLSPSGGTEWSSNLISAPIFPGQATQVNFMGFQCNFDLRVRTSNGQTDERRNLDVCNTDFVNFP